MDNSLPLTRKIQLKELEILKVFQEICRRHNLRYFAIGGTCLGAVRHKGFIPWDDDMDIAMPYEDYIKFQDIAKSELPANYSIYGVRTSRYFYPAYAARLQDKNTTYTSPEILKLGVSELCLGMHIDILIVNGLPEGKLAQKLLSFKLNVYKFFNKLIRIPFYSRSKSALKRLLKKAIYLLIKPLRLLSPNCHLYFTNQQENMLKQYPFECSDKIIFVWRGSRPNKFGWYKNIFYYEDFKSIIYLQFEDTTIAVPVGYSRYLTMDYGNYMQLPPQESINQYENYVKGMVIDFDRPYTYYIDHPEVLQ